RDVRILRHGHREDRRHRLVGVRIRRGCTTAYRPVAFAFQGDSHGLYSKRAAVRHLRAHLERLTRYDGRHHRRRGECCKWTWRFLGAAGCAAATRTMPRAVLIASWI